MTVRIRAVLVPSALAALAATRYGPMAVPAMLLLFGWLPGRIVVRAAGLAGGWDGAGRFVLAVAGSLAVAPVALNVLWHVTNNGWALLAGCWLLAVAGNALAARRGSDGDGTPSDEAFPRRLFDRTSTRVVAGLLCALVAFATIGTYWPTELWGYPVPALLHDFVKHHAVLFSMQHKPLPLGNPFFAEQADAPVYYYHFFYLVPATVRAVAPAVSIELAFGLQAAAVGIATAAMFYLLVKRVAGGDGPALLGALLVTAVGGLDVVPLVLRRLPVVTLDAWSDPIYRIHNFFTQMIWSPQNVQGVLIALVAVYALSVKGWWRGWWVLAPVVGAGVVGSSIWVAVPVAAGGVLWVAREVLAAGHAVGARWRRLAAAIGVGVLTAAVCAPSLWGYAQMSQRLGKSLTAAWPYQQFALLGRLVRPGALANLLDLPWVLLVELGPLAVFPLLAPRAVWRRVWQDAGLRLLLLSGAAAVIGYVTVRSHFTYNDFGQKAMMVAMAALVVPAACVLGPARWRPTIFNPLGWSLCDGGSTGRRRITAGVVGLLLLAGLPVGLYEAPLTAVRRYLDPGGRFRVFAHETAERLAREGRAYGVLRHELPAGAVVQADWRDDRVNLVQIARKRVGATILQMDTMVFAPADRVAHTRCLAEVSAALGLPGPSADCGAVLRRHCITHVFVGEVERRRWQGIEKLRDPRFFDTVYRDAHAEVIALRLNASGP